MYHELRKRDTSAVARQRSCGYHAVMASNDLPILVVGGGLGGLTTALALGRKGWPVRVLEQTPEIEPIGYGIQLGPNVFHMLERLGVADAVQKHSHFPSAILMLDALDGREVARIPCGTPLQRRFKHPYVVIHRVDLHRVLLDACQHIPAIRLQASTTVTGFEDLGGRVSVASKAAERSKARRSSGRMGCGRACAPNSSTKASRT